MRITTGRVFGAVAALTVAVFLLPIGVDAVRSRNDRSCPGPTSLNTKTLTVEGDPWAGYASFRDPNLLKGSGYTLKYMEQLDQARRACDLTSGKAGFIVTTLDQFLANKPDGKIVGIIDQSAGADALVLGTARHSYLTSLDRVVRLVNEAKSRRAKPVLAYTGNSPSDFLLTVIASSSEDLRLEDFYLVSVDQSSTAAKMLADGRADVAVLWEPDVSAARAAGNTVAASSKDYPNAIVDVLVASTRLIDQEPLAVQAMVNGFYAARSAAVADPATFEAAMAKDTSLPPEQARALLAGIRFYNAREADQFINTRAWPLNQTGLEESLEEIGALLSFKDSSITPRRDMWDGRFVHAAP